MKFPNGRTTSTPGHAFGGIINGPGTDTSDSILGLDRFGMPTARVSRGEFVVNAEATRKHRAALELINSGRLPKFGLGGFLKWTSPILANESVRNATMPIMNSGFRNATMPIMNGGFRNATMPAIGYLGGNNGPQLNGPANAGATNAPPAETHKHYHFNVHAHGSDAAQSIQKSRRQLARQARETLSSAA